MAKARGTEGWGDGVFGSVTVLELGSDYRDVGNWEVYGGDELVH